MQHTCKPAILIQRTVTEHLEVLNRVTLRRIGVIQAIHQARTCHRLLNRPVHTGWLWQAGRFENRGRNIDHVRELAADLALALDALRPVDHHAVTGAAKVRGNLLGPLEGRVKGDCPTR